MIYIIKNKPYVKVANYFKMVKITKNGNEYDVVPIGGKETEIQNSKDIKISEISLKEYNNKYLSKSKNNIDFETNDFE